MALLGDDHYTIPYHNTNVKSLTIIGTEGTQVDFNGGNVSLTHLNQFTIKNCEVFKMASKSWGMMVYNSGRANGVYTIDNCTFNGVGTQGVYINESNSSAVYNITNCTFNGDFGGEGAVTIQVNLNVNHTVNVTGCTFNNIPSTSHKICFVGAGYRTPNLNTDVAESDIYIK